MPGLSPPSDLDVVDYIVQTRESYAHLGFEPYRWSLSEASTPLAIPGKPLAESRVALVASGGVYMLGQTAFHHRDDTSYRRIPSDTAIVDLRVSHFAYDQTNARRDPNIVFPLEPLRRLVADATIGSLTSHALGFMGGIYSQRRVREELAPRLQAEVEQMAADIVLLVPV